jgi:hypothetical protein
MKATRAADTILCNGYLYRAGQEQGVVGKCGVFTFLEYASAKGTAEKVGGGSGMTRSRWEGSNERGGIMCRLLLPRSRAQHVRGMWMVGGDSLDTSMLQRKESHLRELSDVLTFKACGPL